MAGTGLRELIEQGEGPTLEFKSTIQSADKIARTLAAFANTRGGILLVGVEDDGQVSGILSEAEEMGKIETAADRLLDPPVNLEYESRRVGEMHVLLIRVAESEQKPHRVKDPKGELQVYLRVHDKNVPAGKEAEKTLAYEPAPVDKAVLQSPNVKTLLQYLQTNEYITLKRYAKLINISERRAAKLLADLVEGQVIVPVDRGNGIGYALK
jgi:predicted HTH transcriptional regulator